MSTRFVRSLAIAAVGMAVVQGPAMAAGASQVTQPVQVTTADLDPARPGPALHHTQCGHRPRQSAQRGQHGERSPDQAVRRRIGVFGNNFDVSAPPVLATSNAFVMVGWDDTRNAERGELGSGTQDLFTAAVQYQAVGTGTSNVVKVVLASVAGLLLVGLILLAAGLASRRRGEPQTAESSLPGRTAAGAGG